MGLEVWVGKVEVRQLPGDGHKIELSGKGAFTWITCWAEDADGYGRRVSEVLKSYGLFVVETKEVMPFSQAEAAGAVTDKLFEQYEETRVNQNFCIFGTFHTYTTDN
jgi:hypothetical protein